MSFKSLLLDWILAGLYWLGVIKYTFGFSEPGVPVIPAGAVWINQNQTTQTGTMTNGSANITALTATAQLVVGQLVTISIAGLAQPAYITVIVSGTSVTLSQTFTGVTGSATVTFYPVNANQSQWAGAFVGFPGPGLAAISSDTPDCPFNIPDTQTLLATSTFVPAPGRGVLTMAAFTTTAGGVQYNINGTWTSLPVPYTGNTSAASGCYVMADGVNVRWNNAGAATCLFTFYRERSSRSTSF